MENKTLILLAIFLMVGCTPPQETIPGNLSKTITSSISFLGEEGGIIIQGGECEAIMGSNHHKSRACSAEEAEIISVSLTLEKAPNPERLSPCENDFLRVKVLSEFLVYGDDGCYSINGIPRQGPQQQTKEIKALSVKTKHIVAKSEFFTY
jgi:hypothetical protein